VEPTQRTRLAVGRLGGRLPLNLALTSAHVDYPIKPTASARRRRDARRGCTGGRFSFGVAFFVWGIEALRRHALAGGRASFPGDRGELASRRTDARCARRAYRGVHTADGSEG
jgi:hypothetical protein